MGDEEGKITLKLMSDSDSSWGDPLIPVEVPYTYIPFPTRKLDESTIKKLDFKALVKALDNEFKQLFDRLDKIEKSLHERMDNLEEKIEEKIKRGI